MFSGKQKVQSVYDKFHLTWHRPRITFKFPHDWIVNANVEKYIGLVSMYITCAFRKVDFTLLVEIVDDEKSYSQQKIHIYKYFKDDTTLQQCMVSFNEMFEKKFNTELLSRYLDEWKKEGIQPQIIDFHYEFVKKEDGTHDCQFVINSPFNIVVEEKQIPLRIAFDVINS